MHAFVCLAWCQWWTRWFLEIQGQNGRHVHGDARKRIVQTAVQTAHALATCCFYDNLRQCHIKLSSLQPSQKTVGMQGLTASSDIQEYQTWKQKYSETLPAHKMRRDLVGWHELPSSTQYNPTYSVAPNCHTDTLSQMGSSRVWSYLIYNSGGPLTVIGWSSEWILLMV